MQQSSFFIKLATQSDTLILTQPSTKGEWVHFQGKQLLFSFLASNLIRGQLLKKRICSSRSKFFPLTVDPILKGLHESKQEVTEVVPLCQKKWQKIWSVSNHPIMPDTCLNFKTFMVLIGRLLQFITALNLN